MGSNRVPAWVWALLIGGHVVALGWALHSGSWAFSDSSRYQQAADNLREHGKLYARPWVGMPEGQAVQEFTIRPLGYPLVLYALNKTSGLPIILLVVQNLLSLLNLTVVLRWWNATVQPTGKDWVWALIAIFCFPAQFIYANAVMGEILLQTLAVLLVTAGLLFLRAAKKQYAIGASLALTLALLVKPVFYPLAGGFALLGVVLAIRNRRLALFFIGLGPLICVLLYMGWNYRRTGYFHYSSIAEINLLHYNAAGVVRKSEGSVAEEQWVNNVLAQANAQPDFAARQRLIQDMGLTVLRAHPVLYARQHAQGMVTFFLDPGRFDVAQFLRLGAPDAHGFLASAREGELLRALGKVPTGLLVYLAIILLANIVRVGLAIRGFVLIANSSPQLRYGRWVAAGLLLYVALMTGPLGAARFLVPVWPLLLGFALVGLRGATTLKVGQGAVANG